MAKKSTISKGKLRSAARLAAVQALYDMELASHDADRVIRDFAVRGSVADLDGEEIPADPDLFAALVRGVSGGTEALDGLADGAMDGKRKIANLETLVRIILRAGAFELTQRPDIDPPLTISAYLAVTSAFFSGGEPGFVNGVLDRIARAVRPEDLAGRADAGHG